MLEPASRRLRSLGFVGIQEFDGTNDGIRKAQRGDVPSIPLTDTVVRNAKGKEKPYKLTDRSWLFLLVNPDGKRFWRASYRFAGKQKTLALGPYPAVSLADARKQRDTLKEHLAQGIDPSEAKKADKRASALNSSHTFEAIGREWFAPKLPGWVPSHSDRLMSRREADVFPALGSRPIADIEPPEVLEVIRKVETRGAIKLAKREMQVIGQIFRFAIATGRAKRGPHAGPARRLEIARQAEAPPHHLAQRGWLPSGLDRTAARA
ncbi:integrase arm-type DNA-binding domain-containing protein [Xanthobacter autotrophicus]|uniref:tyrosine-type recombinase/integrase n=1 Tax=Xanthobacter autotrophicus TaxID=280 RepID=UPI00372A8D35